MASGAVPRQGLLRRGVGRGWASGRAGLGQGQGWGRQSPGLFCRAQAGASARRRRRRRARPRTSSGGPGDVTVRGLYSCTLWHYNALPFFSSSSCPLRLNPFLCALTSCGNMSDGMSELCGADMRSIGLQTSCLHEVNAMCLEEFHSHKCGVADPCCGMHGPRNYAARHWHSKQPAGIDCTHVRLQNAGKCVKSSALPFFTPPSPSCNGHTQHVQVNDTHTARLLPILALQRQSICCLGAAPWRCSSSLSKQRRLVRKGVLTVRRWL